MTRPPPNPGFIWVLAAISIAGPLAVHLFLPVLPVVKAVFAIPDSIAGFSFSVTLLVMAFATLAYGSLSDRYGRRPVLLGGLMLFCAGSALCALAPSVGVLLVGRVLQAVGAACGMTLARTIARDAYGTQSLVKIIAYLTMAYTLGPLLAPAMGGFITDTIGWRGSFAFALAAGLGISAAVFFIVHETRPANLPRQGAREILAGYGTLLTHVRFLAFVMQPGFSTGAFLTLSAASAFLMSENLARSPTEYGMWFWLLPIGYALGNWIASRLSHRASVEQVIMAGSLLNTLVISTQAAILLSGHLSPAALFVPGAIMCGAQGLALPNAQVGALRIMPGLAGTAAGLGFFFQMFVAAVLSQAYAFFADGTPLPMVAVMLAAMVLAQAAAVYLSLTKRRDGASAGRTDG